MTCKISQTVTSNTTHLGYKECLAYKLRNLKEGMIFRFCSENRCIGYDLNVMRQSACLVFNPIMVDNYAAFFN